MIPFEDYAERFQFVRMERREGILQLTLHTEGGPLRWGMPVHSELPDVFHCVAQDRDTKVVILTGTGAEFSGPRPDPAKRRAGGPSTPSKWDRTYWEGKHLLGNFLNIEVPVISAVNGPALRHSELPLLGDIVLASTTASFSDSAHFNGGLVPGDGVHVVYPILLGLNRGRYFLLTGQTIEAAEAKDLGLVAEVLAPAALLPRAWELATEIAAKPDLMRRYTRVLFTEYIKRQMQSLLGYGLALEGLALIDPPAE